MVCFVCVCVCLCHALSYEDTVAIHVPLLNVTFLDGTTRFVMFNTMLVYSQMELDIDRRFTVMSNKFSISCWHNSQTTHCRCNLTSFLNRDTTGCVNRVCFFARLFRAL